MTGQPAPEPPAWEVYALRYGTLPGRRRGENVIGSPDPAAPMPMDYFIWLLRSPDRDVLVDTGFSIAEGARRGRRTLVPVPDLLQSLGVDPDGVRDVMLTHLHYDHAGNVDTFPQATLWFQRTELEFATGPAMAHPFFAEAYDLRAVASLRASSLSRLRLVDGLTSPYPGIELHRVGGHTGGLQVVRVHTEEGWYVLASDASHFSENRETRRPFPIVADLAEMFAGWEACERLASSPTLIVPGHDPAVLQAGSQAGPHADVRLLTPARP